MSQTKQRPQQQLQTYFNDLLNSGDVVEEETVRSEPTKAFVDPNPSLKKWQQEQLQGLLKNLSPAPDVTINSTAVTEAETAPPTTVAAKTPTTTTKWQPLEIVWNDNGRPEWAQAPFDVLLVVVNGMHLAMPLCALDNIYPLSNNLTPLFEQPQWFMGLQKTLTGNINVIDTTLFIMPERHAQEVISGYQYCLPINGSGWGLTIDNMYQPITIDPVNVKWRRKREDRQWVAGTLKDQLCILLDIPKFAQLLSQYSSNNK